MLVTLETLRVNKVEYYLVKFGYMVERRSIIFSKLLEGRALSGAAAAAAAAATAAGGGGPTTGGLSPLTEAAPPEGGATAAAEEPPALAPVEVLGTGGSDVLGAELLPSAEGWGWGWFCGCPGTW